MAQGRPLRVNLFANGLLSGGKALLVPATWADFTASASTKLKTTRTPVRIFTAEGGEVSELDELLPEDQLFLVEHDDEFRTPGTGAVASAAAPGDQQGEEIERIDRGPRPSAPAISAPVIGANATASTASTAPTSTSSSLTPPPLAERPRTALPHVNVGSSVETRRMIFRSMEPQLLHLQSLMPGASLSEVANAVALAEHRRDVIKFLQQAHPTNAQDITEGDLTIRSSHTSNRPCFDVTLQTRTPVAPRVRARADFSAVEMNVRDVVGPRFSLGEVRNAVRTANGNAEQAILQLLNQEIP